jgi:hypothetical protein
MAGIDPLLKKALGPKYRRQCHTVGAPCFPAINPEISISEARKEGATTATPLGGP